MLTTLPTRPLANTGIQLSTAGLGTVKIGRNQGVKYPNTFDLPNDRHVIELLDTAQSLGINWLDTAPAYGISEQRLGKLIKRHEWIIASKTGEEFENHQSSFDFSAAHTTQSIHRSLQRLNTDYIDIIFIHSDGNDLKILQQTDCLDALYRAKKEGKIRAIGMSCKTVEGALFAIPYVDALMLTLNPHYTNDIPAIQATHQAGKAVIIKKAFGSGHLTQQYSIPELADYAFTQPITAITTGTLNPQHLIENCHAIASATVNHPL